MSDCIILWNLKSVRLRVKNQSINVKLNNHLSSNTDDKHGKFQSNPTNVNPYLTASPLVLHICISESDQHWFRQWLVAYSAPNHYLNQCWVFVNWSLRNKLQWNFNQNANLLIHKNVTENIVFETAAILSRGEELRLHEILLFLQ